MSIASKVVSALVLVGMVVSVRDYLGWRRGELAHFGQGPAEASPLPTPQNLAGVWQSDWAGLRLTPIQNWDFQPVSHQPNYSIDRREEVASLDGNDASLSIWVQNYTGNLINATETEEVGLPKLVRERQYLNTDQVHAAILTWTDRELTLQRAVFVEKGKQVIIEAQAPTSVWNAYEPTFWALYESVRLF